MISSSITELNQKVAAVSAESEESQPRAGGREKTMTEASAMTEEGSGGGGNDEEQPSDDEPNWGEIMRHDPARTEVPVFLAARGRRSDADERFAAGLDALHDSVTQSMEGLVEVVTSLLEARAEKLFDYEVNLKNDYAYNEKTRASMQTKLEESARFAQGMFANLLMRVAQPGEEAGGGAASGPSAVGPGGNSGNGDGANADESGKGDGKEGDEEDPDWDAIMKHEPARSEVPGFLAARSRREAACARFEGAIEEFQTSIDGYVQELTQTMADLYNNRAMKLDEYDQILKHDYVANDKRRAKMQANLEESATVARNMFGELMKRVMQPHSQQQQPQEQQPRAAGFLTQAVTLDDSP